MKVAEVVDAGRRQSEPGKSRPMIPDGDLNDWLRVGAKGDPAAFRSVLERALAMSPTPWALQIQRLPSDRRPGTWRTIPVCATYCASSTTRGRLAEMRHLRLLAERCGVALNTLQEAARELAQSADIDP